MKLILITGATRGLGLELLKAALQSQNHVIAIARKSLPEQANLWQITADLDADSKYLKSVESLLGKIGFEKYSDLVLINNAAVVEPIGPSAEISADSLQTSLKVNLQAAMLLTKSFLALTKDKSKKITVVNISSGAGYRPIPGWSAYCVAKAGLNMYTQCLAAEYKSDDRYHFYNFSPGIMDTDMQGQIRSKDKLQFSLVDNFIEYHKTGRLRDPKNVAEKIFVLINQTERFSKVDYDIEEFI